MFGKIGVILGLVCVLIERLVYHDGELFFMGMISIAVGALIMWENERADKLK